jgi:hypothetical protein
MAQTLEQAIRPLQIVVAALIAGVTAFLAIALFIGPLTKSPDPARRFAVAGGGLIEGPTFFALVVYLLSGLTLVLGAAGLGIALLGAHFPTASSLRRLAEEGAAQ